MRILLIILYICAIGWTASAAAQQTPETAWQQQARSIIGALDYVAVDYPVAVKNGAVINGDEYAEQREFLVTVVELLAALPVRPQSEGFHEQASTLAALIDQKADAEAVTGGCRQLAASLIETYDLSIAPAVTPDPAKGTALYASQCAACHGEAGRGDGPAGMQLEPSPTNFLDEERARQRSLYSLYSTITVGVDGTAMPSFSQFEDNDRWALAFYVAGLRDSAANIAAGERVWNSDGSTKPALTLASFTGNTPAELEAGSAKTAPLLAYLRHHPEAFSETAVSPIERTLQGLQAALKAYDNQQQKEAMQLALLAYLEGYELIEGPLRALDSKLAIGIERDLQKFRGQIRDQVPVKDLRKANAEIALRLNGAAKLLDEKGSSPLTLFVSALIILLREGLEAILIIAAMALYLRRTEQVRGLRYLHFGWVAALAVGALTWVAFKMLIDISGAQREVMEGAGALLAAAVLLYVGIWMHRHGSAEHWQAFLKQRLGRSLSTGAMWGVAALAFIAVYREILETVLFYETLWLQSAQALPLVLGAAAAACALAVLGWLLFRVGARLPLRQFFQVNGIFMFVLAVVFAGKGISALQEAGWVNVTFINLPRIDLLGLYPTAQTAGMQAAVIVVGIGWWLISSRRQSTIDR